jgi:hypothetical protein
MKFTHIKYIGFFVLFAGLVACSDSNTGSDPGDPPQLPTVQSQEASPDLTFFENNQPKSVANSSHTSNYSDARDFATNNSFRFAYGQSYASFFSSANAQSPDFKNGKWVWEYSYNFEGQSLEIRLTAEDVSAGYRWEYYISYDDGQGNSIDNYLLMEGTTTQDGSEGDWTFNAIDPETDQERKAITSTWEVISDTESNMTVEYFDESGNAVVTSMYEMDEPVHTLEYIFPNSDNITVYWNTDTQTGYIERGTDRNCWDSNFENVSCN